MHTDELQNLINTELGLPDGIVASENTSQVADAVATHLYELSYKELFLEVASKISEEQLTEFKTVLETGDVESLRSFIQKHIGEPDAFINQSFEKTLHNLENVAVSEQGGKPLVVGQETHLTEAQRIIDKDIATLLKITNFTNEKQNSDGRTEEWKTLQHSDAQEILNFASNADATQTKGKVALWLESVSGTTKQIPLPQETVAQYALRAISTYLSKQTT